jgi:hypothetical protein
MLFVRSRYRFHGNGFSKKYFKKRRINGELEVALSNFCIMIHIHESFHEQF